MLPSFCGDGAIPSTAFGNDRKHVVVATMRPLLRSSSPATTEPWNPNPGAAPDGEGWRYAIPASFDSGPLLHSSSPVQATRTFRSRFCNKTYNESISLQWPTFDLCHSGKMDPC
ncbi:hypothetical protein MRB53_028702 [Persea americana]|uniref:Uncharacterized protein n=1 Tax=Persea americana TaxID=3435 RepID=A0ACC2KGX3_PERAE|nr:hypothetical protein MRB53_028702 [Persea americana]